MNGLSLQVALATVGVEVGWEAGHDQQLVYTFRIESNLLETLRGPDAVRSPVGLKDRLIRKFRVAMGPRSQSQQASPAMANEVTYGWGPNKDNPRELDYYVQLTPERLETLAKGIPVDCEVHPSVPEIHRIYVFRGVEKLPRELPEHLQVAASATRSLQGNDNFARPATNSVTPASSTESRFGTPEFSDPRFTGGGTTRTAVGDQLKSPRNYAGDNGWQREDHRQSNASAYGPETRQNHDLRSASVSSDVYNRRRNEMIDVPMADRNRQLQTPGLQYDRSLRYPDDRIAYRTEASRPPVSNSTSANDETTKQLLAVVQANQDMVEELKREREKDANRVVAAGYNAATPGQQNLVTPEKTSSTESLRTPLVVTMLALFASLCANAYIGWLAWSFFWRFRNAASDLARAQTAATIRQAA